MIGVKFGVSLAMLFGLMFGLNRVVYCETFILPGIGFENCFQGA